MIHLENIKNHLLIDMKKRQNNYFVFFKLIPRVDPMDDNTSIIK